MLAGYGNNSGVFSQTDGNTLIGGSLLVGWGLQGNKSGSFTATYGTVVVKGDVWVGDPNADPNQGNISSTLTIGSGPTEYGTGVLKVDGNIHVCQMPSCTPASVATFWEVGSTDPCRALSLFNDGSVFFNNDSNYNYVFDKIVSTEPSSVGRFVITHRCIVSVNQINQRYVEIDGGWHGACWSCNLNVLGTPGAYESNIIDGMENYDGNFRVRDAKVTMGFLTTIAMGGFPAEGTSGRVWIDSNGIVSVTYAYLSLLSICPTGQFSVVGQAAYVPTGSEDPLITQPMKVESVENDGNLHLSNCRLTANRIGGVGGGVGGWTIADSNVVLTINNNLEQAFVTIVGSAQVTVKNDYGFSESNVADGIECDGNFRLAAGALFTPYVEGIGGLPAGRIWLDNDANLVTGRIVQELVYIGDNATLTLYDGGEAEEPNLRTNVYSSGLVHVISGCHVLGKVVAPEPNTCLGAIILEANTTLHVTGFRVEWVAIGPGATLVIEGNMDGSPTTNQTRWLTIANQPDSDANLIVWEGTLDMNRSSLVIHEADANFIRCMARSGFNEGAWDGFGINSRAAADDAFGAEMSGLRTRGPDGTWRLSPVDANGLVFPAVDPNLRYPLFDPNYRSLLRDPNMRGVPTDPNLALPGLLRNRWVPGQGQYWVRRQPNPVHRDLSLASGTRPGPRRWPDNPPPIEGPYRTGPNMAVILVLGALVLMATRHRRVHR